MLIVPPATTILRAALALISSLLPQALGHPQRMTIVSILLLSGDTSLKLSSFLITSFNSLPILDRSVRGLQEPQNFSDTLILEPETLIAVTPLSWLVYGLAFFCAQNLSGA